VDVSALAADEGPGSGYNAREPVPRSPAMDALDLIKTDHDTVKDLLQRLEESTDTSEREELFHTLREELSDHETIEEEIFYPTLKESIESQQLVLEAYEEHQAVDYVIEDMAGFPIGSEEWMAKLAVAREAIERHIAKEEGQLFDIAEQVFDEDDLEQLGEELSERKLELQMSHH
jgi:hemerythrin-like domain-containing protein